MSVTVGGLEFEFSDVESINYDIKQKEFAVIFKGGYQQTFDVPPDEIQDFHKLFWRIATEKSD